MHSDNQTFTARILIRPDDVIAEVPPRLFGSFVEHMGRSVYTGIFEPGHPTADADGFRRDVLDMVAQLGVTVVRYPGGNFVSGYNWEDGVGPSESRPRRLELAWHEIETNAFGLHEFVGWSNKAGIEIMYAVNLGSRGIDDARRLLEYANHARGTELSDRRRANGAEEPFGITLWCLGNEMDGPWQIGQKTADEYGRLAAETAKVMKLVDPSIELVVAGSSSMDMATFGSWEKTVLSHTYEHIDYLSLHAYYQEREQNPQDFLASAEALSRYIATVVDIVDTVKTEGGYTKQVDLALDEWNVWDQDAFNEPEHQAALSAADWLEHPRVIEDEYTVTDAVVVGTLLHTLLRHSDRVKIANMAQLVNVIAPIRTEEAGPAWRQTTFFPFARIAEFARGSVIGVDVESPAFSLSNGDAVFAVDATSTLEAETGTYSVFVANRSFDQSAQTTVSIVGVDVEQVLSAEVLAAPAGHNRLVSNTATDPTLVGLHPLEVVLADDGVCATLPPMSWAVVRVTGSRR